jgi:hypothetical protein
MVVPEKNIGEKRKIVYGGKFKKGKEKDKAACEHYLYNYYS